MGLINKQDGGVPVPQDRKNGDPISHQAARDQVKILIDYYEIEPENMAKEEMKETMEMSISQLEKSVRKGRVTIEETDDGLTVTQKLKKPLGEANVIEYKELTGAAKVEMEKNCKVNHNYKKIYALCGAMSGLPESFFQKLRGVDMSDAESLGMIFLQV